MILFMMGSGIVYGDVNSVDLNKSSYTEGDTVTISGNVDYDPANPFVIIQIINPDRSGVSYVTQLTAKSNGDFSTSFIADGNNWSTPGTYTIKISSAGTIQKDLVFSLDSSQKQPPTPSEQPPTPSPKKSNTSPPNTPPSSTTLPPTKSTPTPPPTKSTPPPSSSPPPPESVPNTVSPNSKTSEPVIDKIALKSKILGFLALDESPQYYIDRYNNEPDYKSWFDSIFPDYSIDDVIAYSDTTVPNYPDNAKSPKYYIDRYVYESAYRSWFDSTLPDQTPYSVLGFTGSDIALSWFKHHASLWASDPMDDLQFLLAVKFLVESDIIQDHSDPSSQTISGASIPKWMRNSAEWWSDDLISDSEFIPSLQYLIDKQIIIIN